MDTASPSFSLDKFRRPSCWIIRARPNIIPGAPISREGEPCSFTLMKAFGLRDPALLPLARIVRDDDRAMLAAALPLYDALYAWCQGAQAKSQSWNPAAMAGPAR